MSKDNVSRRTFVKQSATVAAAGAAVGAGSAVSAAQSAAEVAAWQGKVGSRFQVADAELQLSSVDVSDHSADAARSRHLRPHSIAMLLTVKSGPLNISEYHSLRTDGHELMLTPVVAPEGQRGQYFEAVLN